MNFTQIPEEDMFKRSLAIIVVFALTFINNLSAQDEFQKYVEKVAKEQIEGYIKPFTTAFSTAINSGLYHTAQTHKTGGFDLTIKGIAVMIPGKAKTFTAYIPPGGSQEWSTIFGPKRSDNTPPENLNPGGLDLKLVPMAVPQISFGIGNDFETLIRFLKFDLGRFGDVSLYGIGLKHNLKRYFLKLPGIPDISIQGAYQIFKAGDIVDSKSLSLNAHISKSLLLFTLFGGVGFEYTNFDIDYTFAGPGHEKVFIAMKEKNNPRFVGGIMFKLGLLSLNCEINWGKYNSISAGVGITFR